MVKVIGLNGVMIERLSNIIMGLLSIPDVSNALSAIGESKTPGPVTFVMKIRLLK